MLPPSYLLKLDRAGLRHARNSDNIDIYIRRLVSLVFDFEEIMSSTLSGHKSKRASKRDIDDMPKDADDKTKGVLSPWKIDQIIGKYDYDIRSVVTNYQSYSFFVYVLDSALDRFPNESKDPKNIIHLQGIIRKQVSKIKYGDLSAMERATLKGFTPWKLANRIGKHVSELTFFSKLKPEEKELILAEEETEKTETTERTQENDDFEEQNIFNN